MTLFEMASMVLGSGVVSGGTVGAIATAVVSRGRSRDALARSTDANETKRELAQLDAHEKLRLVLVDAHREMLAELKSERAAHDGARAEHADCRRLVGEAVGRIEMLEVGLSKTEVQRDECREESLALRNEFAAFKARVESELARR